MHSASDSDVRDKIKLLCVAFSIAFLMPGCGSAFLPEATKKPVSAKDLVGTWEYPADYGKTTVTLELKDDGTFVQTIRRGGVPKDQVHSGKWSVHEASPKLTVLKPVFGDPAKPWIAEEVDWWIMDSVLNENREFSICGAADDGDPDSCFEMRSIRE